MAPLLIIIRSFIGILLYVEILISFRKRAVKIFLLLLVHKLGIWTRVFESLMHSWIVILPQNLVL